ncbi:MAG: hypothetical protein UW68_C0012G0001 [Candidatus Collierbacteria bacterium GW2011_GWB1_44_6]|uniref:Uncharacterized protein n=1 Tax=Candidatus Collierbacteria bacterium GW2011_GWB1_44_6 TaxID=1618384 RepID=A0A0G1JPQ2_9BACT|nr:MAG: hypothetical protein UW68_C0012G0001 [Candidatus Collierbacteria bacterium GW2011_GWB1_44_6]
MFGYFKSSQEQRRTVSVNHPMTILNISKQIMSASTKPIDIVENQPQNGLFAIKYLISIVILCSFFTAVFSTDVNADTLTSPTFEINMGTINISGGGATSPSFNVTQTTGQTFQGQFDSAGFVVKAGFQYIYPLTPFTFTISNLDLNFGSLVPGTPSLLTNILTVTTGSAFGYTVKTIEDHPLRLVNGSETIPDTPCDLVSPCTQTDATAWTDNTRFGFGYGIQGTDVDTADFVDNTYFRPFPVQNTDDPATIMSRTGVATASAATVTYKINIPGSQAAGTYQNNIQYIAIPSF